MAEEQQQAAAPQMRVLNQYVRDLSFENIAAQKADAPKTPPEINVGVNLDARKAGEDSYEVMLKLNVSAEADGKKVFLMEIDYAGLFHIQNLPDDQIHAYLMIECPRMMFPFVRQIVRDTAINGGFPALNVDPIDFVALYRQEIERRVAAQAKEETKN